MRVSSYTLVLLGFAASLMVSGCSNESSVTLEDIGGERYPFHSPLTTLTRSSNDSLLLVATNNGIIASFNTFNGDFQELFVDESGSTVYDINDVCSEIFLGIRDRGVRRIRDWNDKHGIVYRINRIKETDYSPYTIHVDTLWNTLFACTSNGVYSWPLTDAVDYANKIKADKKAGPLSYYSIIQDELEKDYLVFSGEDGVYGLKRSFSRETIDTLLTDFKVLDLHDSMMLLDKGILCQFFEYGQPETLFKSDYSPFSFVVHEDYVYLISVSAIEVINKKDIKDYLRIDLPEKHLTRPRNKSCRHIGLVKNNYLYIVPGGACLYKLPLAPYNSDEVISLSVGENKIYTLSARNDLYSMRIIKRNGDICLGKPRYLKSFDFGEQVRLLGTTTKGQNLIVSEKEGIYEYSGIKEPFEDSKRILLQSDTSGIKCNLWQNDFLYQGRVDMVRAYGFPSKESSMNPFFRKKKATARCFPKKPFDSLECRDSVTDYYPVSMAIVREYGYLVVGTLHSGVVYTRDIDSAFFSKLISNSEYSLIKDIKAYNNTVYVLDDKRVSRFDFQSDGFKPSSGRLPSIGSMTSYLNCIAPISEDSFIIYSDNYDFCSGAYLCNFKRKDDKGEIELASFTPMFEGTDINDAQVVSIDGNTIVFLGSSRGVIVYSHDSDLPISGFTPTSVQRPKYYVISRMIAWKWPWGLVFSISGVLFLIGIMLLIWELVSTARDKKKARERTLRNQEMLKSWRNAIKNASEEKVQDILNDVEEEQGKNSSFLQELIILKDEEIYPVLDGFILKRIKAQNVSNAKECINVIANAEHIKLYTSSHQAKLKEYCEIVKVIHDRFVYADIENKNTAKAELCENLLKKLRRVSFFTEEYRKKLYDLKKKIEAKHRSMMVAENATIIESEAPFLSKFSSGYILVLFRELLETSKDTSERESNIQRFKLQDTITTTLKKPESRLKCLDRIGHLINDVYFIVSGQFPESAKQEVINTESQVQTLLKICNKYHLMEEKDPFYQTISGFTVFCSIQDIEKYEKALSVINDKKYSILDENMAFVKRIEPCYDTYLHLYDLLKPKMVKVYQDRVKRFFKTFDKDPEFHLVFNDPKEYSHYKGVFLFLPISALRPVIKWLLPSSDTPKSRLKNLPKGEKHSLRTLTEISGSKGLLGLIAQIGLKKADKEDA